MALRIREDCINCAVCVAECPNAAISEGVYLYVIDPMSCTECVGHFEEPQCVRICPVDCIEPDPDHRESLEELERRYRYLTRREGDS